MTTNVNSTNGMQFPNPISAKDGWGKQTKEPKWNAHGEVLESSFVGLLVRHTHQIRRNETNKWVSVKK